MPKRSLFYLLTTFTLLGCGSKNPEELDTVDHCTELEIVEFPTLSETLNPFSPRLDTSSGAYIMEDGGSSLITRAWLCESAEKSIDIQYFIFSLDNVGLIACDYLVRAADRGVRVRILVDDLMVEADLEDVIMLDSHENITVKIFNPGVNLGKNIFEKAGAFLQDFRSANMRMHNKTFIVDGKTAITGGRNVADEYFDYDHQYVFRDRDIFLLGSVVKDMSASFEQYWDHELCKSPQSLTDQKVDSPQANVFNKLHNYACNPANFWPQVRTSINSFDQALDTLISNGHIRWTNKVSFISDEPTKNDNTSGLRGGSKTTDALVELIQNAKHHITIQTPYLVTTEASQTLFAQAVERGVQVKILTNSLASTDNLEAFSGYQRDRHKLLAVGIDIYEFKPDAAIRKELMTAARMDSIEVFPTFGLHAKSMVVDSNIAVIGTFNLDPRSAHLNTECITVIEDSVLAGNMLHEMEKEFLPENAWHITGSFNPDSEVDLEKRIDTWKRRVIPKDIL